MKVVKKKPQISQIQSIESVKSIQSGSIPLENIMNEERLNRLTNKSPTDWTGWR
jgi:hypothetical protein